MKLLYAFSFRLKLLLFFQKMMLPCHPLELLQFQVKCQKREIHIRRRLKQKVCYMLSHYLSWGAFCFHRLFKDKVYYSINCMNNMMAALRPRIAQGLLLASQTSTPRFTPPGSPPIQSASVSPTRTPKPVSPRRHSISFSTSRGMFDDRSSVFASSQHSSVSSLDPGSQSG